MGGAGDAATRNLNYKNARLARAFLLTTAIQRSILVGMNELFIRPVDDADIPIIVDIYNYYIAATTASFEEVTVNWEEMSRRVEGVTAQRLPWLCAVVEGRLAGYAYASRWRERSAYRYTAETTIYLAQAFTGMGIGKTLYSTLLEQVRAAAVHTVMAVITLPNPASVALHESLGYRKVGELNEVGYKFKRWIDVGYWQLLFKTEIQKENL